MFARVLLPTLLILAASAVHAASWEREFQAARKAAADGKVADLARFEKHFADHPLAPYVAYWRLAQRLDSASDDDIRDFIARHNDSPLSDRLRREWLNRVGRRGDWDTLLAEYPLLVGTDPVLTCHVLYARVLKDEATAVKESVTLWLTGRDLPEPCTPLFERLADKKLLSGDDVWRRIRLAFEAGNTGVARHVMRYLPHDEQPRTADLDAATAKPSQWLAHHEAGWEPRGQRELAVMALERMARDDPDAAAERLAAISHDWPVADAKYAWGRIAFRAARSHHEQALAWFRAAGAELGDEQLGWKVRAALRQGMWADVLEAIAAMSEKAAEEPAWRYWKARALKMQGRLPQANLLLATLSRETHFYGQLALEEIGVVASRPPATWRPEDADIEDIRRIPAIQRALMLNEFGFPAEASAEWEWATRRFDDRRLIAAAALALKENWVDRAIRSADKTRELHDFDLRYPAPYRELAVEHAKKSGLDEAWVFGLIRQESRFTPHAKSSAGARGLMQIMPATARWIARQLGVKPKEAQAMGEPGRNLAYGTYYLKYVLDHLDSHPVLATAAYNAGPRRARRWQAAGELEGAIYAETIPFGETRDYVKKVLNNAVHYAARFGQPGATLKMRLGVIPGRPGAVSADNGSADLPE